MEFEEYLNRQPTATCYKIALTAHDKLAEYEKVVCAVSGGSDSDDVVDVVEHCKPSGALVDYVWFDTGIEYQATKQHLKYLEDRYTITIHRIRPKEPVPLACKNHGVPFISKRVSDYIYRLQKHNFDWSDGSFEDLYERYPRCRSALKWWTNTGNNFVINKQGGVYLKEFLIETPPPFSISNKCCDYAKKSCLKQVIHDYDLNIFGVRQAEGGVRATAYKSCFSKTNKYGVAEYRPLFFMTNADKSAYETEFDIVHSECYTKYGLKRTGCVGCPFGSKAIEELEAIKDYEPQLYKAAWNIFGEALMYKEQYNAFAEEKKKQRKVQTI